MPYYGGGRVIRGGGYANLEANMMAAQAIANAIREIQAGQQRRGGQEFLSRLAMAQTPEARQQAIQTPTQGPQGWLGRLMQPVNPFGTAGGYSPVQQGYLTKMMDDQSRESEYNQRMQLQNQMQQQGEVRRSKLSEDAQARGEQRRAKLNQSDPYYKERLRQLQTPEEEWEQTPSEKAYMKYQDLAQKSTDEKHIDYYRRKAESTPYYQQTVRPEEEFNAEHQKYLGKMRYDEGFWNRGGRIEINVGSDDNPQWRDAEDSEVRMLLEESLSFQEPAEQSEIKKALYNNDIDKQRELLKNIIKKEDMETTENIDHLFYGPGQTPPPKNLEEFKNNVKRLGYNTTQSKSYYEQFKHLFGLD